MVSVVRLYEFSFLLQFIATLRRGVVQQSISSLEYNYDEYGRKRLVEFNRQLSRMERDFQK